MVKMKLRVHDSTWYISTVDCVVALVITRYIVMPPSYDRFSCKGDVTQTVPCDCNVLTQHEKQQDGCFGSWKGNDGNQNGQGHASKVQHGCNLAFGMKHFLGLLSWAA
mmetsp:Transcript_5912/g.10794  ORF Transcript_5912/g.10794 Transcript_5912/m.10794 type:complete len:108 (+) Transcript_5912:1374-1697(+)